METKRCQRCHKLLRADAQICSRCGGRDFLQGTQARSKPTGKLLSHDGTSLVPSNPPASPHRAGHYSGLHPEDQPYQSSFLPVQRPPVAKSHFAASALEAGEVEDLSYTTVLDEPIAPAPTSPTRRQVASLSPLPQPRQQRGMQGYRAPVIAQDETERDLDAVYLSAPVAPGAEPRPLAIPSRPPQRKRRGHLVPILLITSCFLFVVATSILAFLLVNNKPGPVLKPALFVEPAGTFRVDDPVQISGSGFAANSAVTLTRDTNIAVQDASGAPLRTFATGNFLAHIVIAGDWSVGSHRIFATDQQGNRTFILITVQATPSTSPQLRLATAHLDLGSDSASVVSHKIITLNNIGGGQVVWQGKSDQTWLTLSPNNGVFAGISAVTITVNRGNLAAQSYTGHIRFTQQDSKAPPVMLTVTMAINPATANLVLSYAAFSFQGTTAQNPADQSITIQNTGGQPLSWTASIATSNGGNWLALSSTSGNLPAGGQATMLVSASSVGLTTGTYQGSLTFSYPGASSTPVTVTLTVSPPPEPGLTVQPGGLSFRAIQGRNPPGQSFTITNSGNAPLNWGIVEDGNGQTYAPVSQSHGTLAPSSSVVITVTLSITQVGASVLNALITVKDTDAGTPVKSQAVNVTITIVNQAVISLDQTQLTYNHDSTIPISTQPITITNTGSAQLNWSLTITSSSPIQWLTVDNSGSKLVPGGADFINVQSDSTHLSPGTFTATLTFRDTDAGTPVAPQTVTVTLVVT